VCVRAWLVGMRSHTGRDASVNAQITGLAAGHVADCVTNRS